MTEWGVVGVIVALVGLIAVLVKPMLSLNTSITKLTVMMEQFAENLTDLTGKNSKTHERLFGKLEEQETTLDDHETRITVLEDRRKP